MALAGCNDAGDKAIRVLTKLGVSDSTMVRVNGTELKYRGKVSLEVKTIPAKLSIDEGSADISLTGSATSQAVMEVSYYEYIPGDATVYLENNELKGKSKSGKPVLISNISGTIPANLSLAFELGSGDISLAALQNNPGIQLSTGSGDINIKQAAGWKDAALKTGSGDVTLELSQAGTVEAKTGSGDITVINSKMPVLSLSTGSGDIAFTDSQIESVSADTGSGDIHLKNTKIAKRDFSQGSGEVYEE